MKIRLDYVTNSSSVSYIISVSKNIVDIYNKTFGDYDDVKEQIIAKLLYNEIVLNGNKNIIEGKEIYTKKITFHNRKGVINYEDITDEIFKNFTDEDLWKYIFGEYIINGKMTKLFGISALQVETDK